MLKGVAATEVRLKLNKHAKCLSLATHQRGSTQAFRRAQKPVGYILRNLRNGMEPAEVV